MLRSLYSRLALTLFLLICIVGAVLVGLMGHVTTLYQQEVTQKLNRDLAMYIVDEHPLFIDRDVNEDALNTLFHQMMVINPSIEVYLLDPDGNVVSYNAPPGAVQRKSVSLEPIRAFLEGDTQFPLTGDDPRSVEGSKVFSASEVRAEGVLQGYLYIVLGGQQYEHIAGMIGESFTLHASVIGLLLALGIALCAGLLVFALLTRRLGRLGDIMRRYSHEDPAARYPDGGRDEIDALGSQFNAMAERIGDQLAELQEMDAARRDMVANISHDLRTPLTTMHGYLETLALKREDLDAADARDYLRIALAQSERLSALVDALFELARLESSETVVFSERFSMCELVQDVCQSFELRAAEQGVKLEVDLDPRTPQVHGDISLMQRVLDNLLENGLRHTPEGGTIRVAVGLHFPHVRVTVADSGPGIAAEDVPRVFERFYRQERHRPQHQGGGLGLAIVKRILELHGTDITVSSAAGQGAEFTFFVPAQAR